eukprot:428376_1
MNIKNTILCSICGETKPKSSFSVNQRQKKKGKKKKCKQCASNSNVDPVYNWIKCAQDPNFIIGKHDIVKINDYCFVISSNDLKSCYLYNEMDDKWKKLFSVQNVNHYIYTIALDVDAKNILYIFTVDNIYKTTEIFEIKFDKNCNGKINTQNYMDKNLHSINTKTYMSSIFINGKLYLMRENIKPATPSLDYLIWDKNSSVIEYTDRIIMDLNGCLQKHFFRLQPSSKLLLICLYFDGKMSSMHCHYISTIANKPYRKHHYGRGVKNYYDDFKRSAGRSTTFGTNIINSGCILTEYARSSKFIMFGGRKYLNGDVGDFCNTIFKYDLKSNELQQNKLLCPKMGTYKAVLTRSYGSLRARLLLCGYFKTCWVNWGNWNGKNIPILPYDIINLIVKYYEMKSLSFVHLIGQEPMCHYKRDIKSITKRKWIHTRGGGKKKKKKKKKKI